MASIKPANRVVADNIEHTVEFETDDDHESAESTLSDNNDNPQQKKCAKEKVYNVNLDPLEEEEQKSCAIVTLHCFAAVRNRWSTNDELGVICNRLRGSSRGGAVNIHDHKRTWRNIAKKGDYGDDHSEVPSDGCECVGPHRYCERKITEENEDGKTVLIRQETRIHPSLAKLVFTPGDITVDQLGPLPIRPVKKRAEKPVKNSIEDNLNESLKARRKLLNKMKKKLDELDEIRIEITDNQKKVEELRAEYVELRLGAKGRRMDDDDAEEEPKSKKIKTGKTFEKNDGFGSVKRRRENKEQQARASDESSDVDFEDDDEN